MLHLIKNEKYVIKCDKTCPPKSTFVPTDALNNLDISASTGWMRYDFFLYHKKYRQRSN